jgi:hypothetical protein
VALGAVKLQSVTSGCRLSRQRPRVFLIGAEPETPIGSAELTCVTYAVAWKTDGSDLGDILGTRNRCLGMVRELLTDARETS